MRDLATFAPRWSFRRRGRDTRFPRVPPGIARGDVLYLWDPAASYRRDWAGAGQTIAPTGTVTETERAGARCAVLASTAYYTAPTSPIPSYADEEPWTVYAVAETSDDGKSLSALWQVSAANIQNGSATLYLRELSNTGTGVYVYGNDGAVVVDWAGGVAVTPGRVYLCTGEFGASVVQAWADGASNGTTAHALSPTGMTNCYMGGSGTASGNIINEGCVLYYVCAVRGTRSAAVEAWLDANFPVGVTP